MSDPLSPEAAATALLAARELLTDAVPHTAEAHADPHAGMLAQRIVGAVAVLDGFLDQATSGQPPLVEASAPPELPAGTPSLGAAWSEYAQRWNDAATLLAGIGTDLEIPVLAETGNRLAEYAATQR